MACADGARGSGKRVVNTRTRPQGKQNTDAPAGEAARRRCLGQRPGPQTHFTVNTAEIRKALTRRETGRFSSTLVCDSRPYPLRACSMSVSSFTTCGRHFGQYVLIMSISSDNEHYNAGLICFCESRLFLFPARGVRRPVYTVRWHAVHDALGPSGRAHEAGTRLHACFFRLLTEQDSSRTTASKTKPRTLRDAT